MDVNRQSARRLGWPGRPRHTRAAQLTLVLLGGLAVLAVAVAVDGWTWWQARELTARIADGSVAAAPDELPPWARFAQAWHVGRKGDALRALSLYKEAEADPALAPAARYNAANLYLREALRNEADAAARLPYLELAKQAYRDALRADPGLWPARYNLERTLRLAPEHDSGEQGEGPQPLQSERAVTTMRGFTLGLP